MWICPKCGREFKRTNQGHYCGKAPESIDEYIELQDASTKAHVVQLIELIVDCIPDVNKRIAWSMPFFEKDEQSISFVTCKKHISLYVDANVIDILRSQLSEFVIKKNAIYLSYDKPLPINIIKEIIRLSFKI